MPHQQGTFRLVNDAYNLPCSATGEPPECGQAERTAGENFLHRKLHRQNDVATLFVARKEFSMANAPRAVNMSQAVRDYLDQKSQAPPSQITEALKAQGLTVSASLIGAVKYRGKDKLAGSRRARKRGRPPGLRREEMPRHYRQRRWWRPKSLSTAWEASRTRVPPSTFSLGCDKPIWALMIPAQLSARCRRILQRPQSNSFAFNLAMCKPDCISV